MKYLIDIYDESRPAGKRIENLASARALEDGVQILLSFAASRAGLPVSLSLGARTKSESWRLAGINCKYTEDKHELARILGNAKKELLKHQEAEKKSAARIAWMRGHGGFTGPLSSLWQEEKFRAALFSNNFEACELIVKELGAPRPINPA